MNIQAAFDFVETKLFCKETSMLCDHVYKNDPENWPTPTECAASFPNPAGYGTGMEDGVLSGGSMLAACVGLHNLNADIHAAAFAEKLCEGLLRCAESAASPGFVPRGLSPFDGKSHYIDSSRDQYTLFFYGFHCYLRSGLCSENHRTRIAEIMEQIARRAEQNVIAETGYDLLREDGGHTLNVTLWGKNIGNHEAMRLPALYLFAYEATENTHWLTLYRSLREEGLARSLPMTSYWHLYTLHQMQSSLRLCYDLDPDANFREKILAVMHAVSDYTAAQADTLAPKLKDSTAYNRPLLPFRQCDRGVQTSYEKLGMPCVSIMRPDADDFFTLQDFADLVLAQNLTPGRKVDAKSAALFEDAFSRIDFEIHERNLPVYFLTALFT